MVELVCNTCEDVRQVAKNTATGFICGECGGSSYHIRGNGQTDWYALQCPKCGVSFQVTAGSNFDIRAFRHCNVHIFKVVDTVPARKREEREEPKPVARKVRPDMGKIISFPFSSEDIMAVKEYADRESLNIAIIYGQEKGRREFQDMRGLSKELGRKYTVHSFNANSFSKMDCLLLNECDLAIGALTELMAYAVRLRVPSIILHTEPDMLNRGEVALFGLKTYRMDDVIEQAESILKIPNLTYCIVTYNRRVEAQRCIEAVMKYKRMNEDIAIVDNASDDGTKEWIGGLKGVRLILNDANIGCIRARNIAMKNASGRYLMLLDSDQVIASDTMHIMRLVDADIVGTEAWDMGSNATPMRVNEDTEKPSYVGAGGMMIARRSAQALNYFDEVYSPAYYEDPDFCWRAKEMGLTIRACKNNIEHLGPGMDETIGKGSAEIKKESKSKFLGIWNKVFSKSANSKPNILFLVDVPGWAWDIKTQNIRKHLEDEFNIIIRYQYQVPDFIKENYDLYFAYDCPFVRRFLNKPRDKIIGGVTAHTYPNFQDYENLLIACGSVHANSRMLFDEIKVINDHAFYVPNGVDENLFKFVPRDISEEFIVGYVGKETARKGYRDFVVPACDRAKVKLKSQTGKYNDLTKIDPYEMPKFYEDVDCIVIASDMDGTPNQLLEAAATGRTFVGVKIGNVPEFCDGENGFMVERDVTKISNKLKWLKKNRERCKAMGEAARKTIEDRWTWRMQAQNYAEMFREILS